MNHRSISVLSSVLLSCALFTGCSESPEIQMVKSGKLGSCPNMTVEEMVNGFLGSPSWDFGTTEGGEKFVNIGGDFTMKGKEVHGVIQFMVDPDAGEFQFNAFEINEVPQPNIMALGLLSKMCEGDSTNVRASVEEAIATTMVAKIAISDTCQIDPSIRSLNNDNAFYAGSDSPFIGNVEISGSCAEGEKVNIAIALSEEIGVEPFVMVLSSTIDGSIPGPWSCISNGPEEYLPEVCQHVDVD